MTLICGKVLASRASSSLLIFRSTKQHTSDKLKQQGPHHDGDLGEGAGALRGEQGKLLTANVVGEPRVSRLLRALCHGLTDCSSHLGWRTPRMAEIQGEGRAAYRHGIQLDSQLWQQAPRDSATAAMQSGGSASKHQLHTS